MKGFYHVFTAEEEEQMVELPTVTHEVDLGGKAFSRNLVARVFQSGELWLEDSRVTLVEEASAEVTKYLRDVKVSMGRLRTRMRLWCTQRVEAESEERVRVSIHAFDEKRKSHVVSRFLFVHNAAAGKVGIEYAERSSNKLSQGSHVRKAVRKKHGEVLQQVADRLLGRKARVTLTLDTVDATDDYDLDEIAQRMRDGVALHLRKRRIVFRGDEAITFLSNEFDLTREMARTLGQNMLNQGYFRSTSPNKAKNVVFADARHGAHYVWTNVIDRLEGDLIDDQFLSPRDQSVDAAPAPAAAVAAQVARLRLPEALKDNDSIPLCAFAGAGVALALYLSQFLLFLIFLGGGWFAYKRGRRHERGSLLARLRENESAAEVKKEEVDVDSGSSGDTLPEIERGEVAPKPVPSKCLLRSMGTHSPPNCDSVPFENEHASGRALLKTRTTPLDPRVESYFQGKNRNFELQVQFELKEPLGDDEMIYVGGEVTEPLDLSVGRRFVCATIVNALKLFHRTLHFSFGGDGENPHLCFPFAVMPDSLLVTAPGQEAPELTLGALPEGKAKANTLVFKPGFLYTLAFYSQFLDLERWLVTRLPGLRDISLKRFWGENSLHVVAYVVNKKDKAEGHFLGKRKVLLDLELTHSSLAGE